MMNNPYASKVFIDTWFEHFGKIGSRAKIKGIEGIEFFKIYFRSTYPKSWLLENELTG